MKTILTMISAGLLFLATSCEKNSNQEMRPADNTPAATTETTNSGKEGVPIVNGADGIDLATGVSSIANVDRSDLRIQKTVYYNNAMFNVVLKPSTYVSPTSVSTLNMVPVVNTIYAVKPLPGTISLLLPVISALPGREFSSSILWRVELLTFTDLNTKPLQFYSSDEISKMLLVSPAPITATKTGTYYEMQLSLIDQPASTK
jgi:hypothetical protein